MSIIKQFLWGESVFPANDNEEITVLAPLELMRMRHSQILTVLKNNALFYLEQIREDQKIIGLINDIFISINSAVQEKYHSIGSLTVSREANFIEDLKEIRWYHYNTNQMLHNEIYLMNNYDYTNSKLFYQQGFVKYTNSEYQEAKDLLTKSIKENTLNLGAHVTLGYTNIRSNLLNEAIENFHNALLITKSIASSPNISSRIIQNTQIFIIQNLAKLYSLLGEHEKSIEQFNKLAEQHNLSECIFNKFDLAKQYALCGDHKTAGDILLSLLAEGETHLSILIFATNNFLPIRPVIIQGLKEMIDQKKEELVRYLKSKEEYIIGEFNNQKVQIWITPVIARFTSSITNESKYSRFLNSDLSSTIHQFFAYVLFLLEIHRKAISEYSLLHLSSTKITSLLNLIEILQGKMHSEDSYNQFSHTVLYNKISANILTACTQKISVIQILQELHRMISAVSMNHLEKHISQNIQAIPLQPESHFYYLREINHLKAILEMKLSEIKESFNTKKKKHRKTKQPSAVNRHIALINVSTNEYFIIIQKYL